MRTQLHAVADRAADFLESLESRPAAATATPAQLFAALDRPLPEAGLPPAQVVEELARDVEGGLLASAGPRFFGFVIGGTTPASVMADWLTSAWDQNAQNFATSPAAAIVETIAARWLLELLELPAESSVGLVTGCQMANFTGLACGRNAVLERAGWDFDSQGLFGAPEIVVLACECAHATVRSALRLLGLGTAQLREIPADSQGRMFLPALAEEIGRCAGRPLLVSLQAGNVNSGSFEPIGEIAELLRGENAWIHVDGAFGLWAAVSPELKGQLRGLGRADSWATDAHKWLNVPYDSGLVVIKDAAMHRRLKTARCAYAGESTEGQRDGSTYSPENSRRARAFVIYAVLRELGRQGVQDLVERSCRLARLFAEGAARLPGASVLNEVNLNQVLIRFKTPEGGDSAAWHREIAARVQADGRCWLGPTVWFGQPALRVSVCSASTTDAHVADALQALAEAIKPRRRTSAP